MRNASVSISQQSLAPATRVTPSTAARTKLLLDGPILTTLLRLAAPNMPARVRGRDHVRRILSRPHRNQCARRRLAGVSLGDDVERQC